MKTSMSFMFLSKFYSLQIIFNGKGKGMKKLLMLILVFSILVPVFAQEKESWRGKRLMAVTTDPASWVTGFGFSTGFEYAFSPMFTGKTQVYYLNQYPNTWAYDIKADTSVSTLRFTLEGRFYPMERNVQGVFASAGMQYMHLFGKFTYYEYDWEFDEATQTSSSKEKSTDYSDGGAFGVYLGIGYKWVIGRSRYGLCIEPSLDYIRSFHFSGLSPYNKGEYDQIYSMGTQGVRFSLNLGIAF